MESLSPPEARGRSRSKTPFLRSSCDQESCAHLSEDHVHDRKKSPYKKSPAVQTIIEEMIEISSTPSRQTRTQMSTQKASSKVITSDYSSEDTSPESARTRLAASGVQTTSSVVTKTQTFSSNLSSSIFGNRSATSKHSSLLLQQSGTSSGLAAKSKEVSQNEINSAFERSQTIQTSTPISTSSKKIVYSSSPTNGDLSGHIAYKEYKEAGEYWKKYPKTDYTYSKLSPHRREIAPGVIAMPNMSRKSLEQHQARVDYMVQQNPAQEMYIRKRYATTTHHQTRENLSQSAGMGYDSQDEADFVEYEDYKKSRYHMLSSQPSFTTYNSSSLVTRTVTRIVTLFTSILSLFWWSGDGNMYQTRIEERKGIFGRMRSAISRAIFKVFRHIYMFISSVLYLDTWLLRSSSTDNRNKKRFLLLMILLLPLLLLAGLDYYLDHPRIPFPPELDLSKISFSMPALNLSQIVDSHQIENMKVSAYEKIDDLKSWSEDYFMYLKIVSQNVASEAMKIWLENFSN